MRHFFVAGPVTTLSRGMAASPCRTILVALSGALLRAAPDPLGAAFGTINLAAVAAAADEHRGLAASAKEPTARGCLRLSFAQAWTTSATGGILPRHACSARVGHGVGLDLAV